MKPRVLLWSLAICVAALAAAQARAWFIAPTLSTSFDPDRSPEMYRPAADGSRPGPGSPPIPVTLEILPLPPGYDPAMITAIEKSAAKWDQVPGAAISLATVRPRPGAPYDPDWLGRYRGGMDGRNTIEFVTRDWHTMWSNNVIARTIIMLDRASGAVLETDIYLNAQDFRWAVFPQEGHFPALEAQSMQDVEAIVTHEIGHVFGIGHSQYSWASMYAAAGYANTLFRRLANDDHQAARHLYPRTEADRPGPSIWAAASGHLDGVCGMTYLSMLSVPVYYSTNLVRTHPLAGDMPFCLFGSGFSQARLQSADLQADGFPLNVITDLEYVGPYLVKAVVSNTPAVPAGTFDFAVENDNGQAGLLVQGLVLNPAGNSLPEAVIEPAKVQVEPGSWVRLDGSGSFDPDGGPVTYRWWVEDSPVGSLGVLEAVDGPVSYLYVPSPGMYVVRLAVSDGTVDGIAAQALVRAEYSLRSGKGRSHDVAPFSCLGWIGAPGPGLPARSGREYAAAALLLLLPLAAWPAARAFLNLRRSRAGLGQG